ncbi:putative reverse transcriptase domain-containing protein, partial [Tanacetum coccineum]
MWHGPILQGIGRRNHTDDLNLCAPNATTIMMGSVLLNAPTTKGLAIQPVTVKASAVAANNNQRAQGVNQRVITCFECGAQGHFKNNCPKLRNKNQGNQDGNGNAMVRAYGVGTVGTNPNSNVVI